MTRLVLVFALAFVVSGADLDSLKSESNLERRSELALLRADDEITAARNAYSLEARSDFLKHVENVGQFADYGVQSLRDSGKDARRSPKYFKRAEQRLRAMVRRLESVAHEVSVEEKVRVEEIRKKLFDLQEEVLLRIMSKKQDGA